MYTMDYQNDHDYFGSPHVIKDSGIPGGQVTFTSGTFSGKEKPSDQKVEMPRKDSESPKKDPERLENNQSVPEGFTFG